MARAKIIKFAIDIPIEEINQSEGLFSKTTIGNIRLIGRGIISPLLLDGMPLDLAEGKPVRVELTSATYDGVNILPIFEAFPACAKMIETLTTAGDATVRQIYAAKVK